MKSQSDIHKHSSEDQLSKALSEKKLIIDRLKGSIVDYERKTLQLEKSIIEKEALVINKESEIGQIRYLKDKL